MYFTFISLVSKFVYVTVIFNKNTLNSWFCVPRLILTLATSFPSKEFAVVSFRVWSMKKYAIYLIKDEFKHQYNDLSTRVILNPYSNNAYRSIYS